MKTSNALRLMGQPIAYYKGLAKPLGGVTAAILFSQLFYWNDKTDNPLGVYKQLQDLCEETGLTLEELNTARKKLKAIGVLQETHKRLEHRLYFKLDLAKFDEFMEMFGEKVNADFTNQEKPVSRNGESPVREQVNADSVIHKITTKNTTLDYNNNTPLPPSGESACADSEVAGEDFAKTQPKQTACKKSKQPEVNYQSIADLYNQANERTGSRLPMVSTLNDKRKRAIKKFLAAIKQPTLACAEKYFEVFFDDLKPHHLGENDRGWRATFDFAIRDDIVLRVREGAL